MFNHTDEQALLGLSRTDWAPHERIGVLIADESDVIRYVYDKFKKTTHLCVDELNS